MSRMARMGFETSFFHIMVQGINKENIFKGHMFKQKYVELIKNNEKQCKVEILSYCIMDNHMHMLIYTDTINNMSKFMHLVNLAYGGFYNKINERVGYVFRDRYKSEPIYKQEYLFNCIRYIHMNPVKAGITNKEEDYKYSTAMEYKQNKGVAKSKILYEIFGNIDYHNSIYKSDDNFFIDIDVDKNKKIDFIIDKYLKTNKIDLSMIVKNKEIFKIFVSELHNNKIKNVEIIKYLNITKSHFYYLMR